MSRRQSTVHPHPRTGLTGHLPSPYYLTEVYDREMRVPRQPDGKATATVKKTQCDVNTFQRWMKSNRGDDRNIEDVPAEELDGILAEFFGTVRRKDGREYESESIRMMQASLERHLREKGYGTSITTSPIFTKSQNTIKKRKKGLAAIPSSLSVIHAALDADNPSTSASNSPFSDQHSKSSVSTPQNDKNT